MARLCNGRLVDGNWHSGREIMADMPGGRRVVEIGKGGVVKNIDPRKNYDPETIARKIKTMPERCKGGYFSPRSSVSKRLILEQIVDVSEKLFKGATGIDYDDLNFDWMVVERYKMPPNWSVGYSPLMLIFPTEYPQLPPVGFYLPKTLNSPNGHLFDGAYHGASDAPIREGWRWYCSYVEQGAWQPSWGRYADDWRKGDNLWDYFTLIGEVLGGSAE